MDANHQLSFLQKRIEEIGSAIFYNLSESVLKLPTSIVSTLKVDEYGYVWFFVQKPKQQLSQFEQEFLVGLNYFKKGKDYFLKIFGKARIVIDPEELAYETDLTTEEINNALTTQVLIKVRIITADFYDNNYEKKNLVLKKVQSWYSRLFDSIGAVSRSFNLTPRSSLPHYGFK